MGPTDPPPADLTQGDPPAAGMSSPVRRSRSIETEFHRAEGLVPAWLRPTGPENRLPVGGAILAAAVLQFAVASRFGITPRWLLPGLELALLVVLVAINPLRMNRRTTFGRIAGLVLVALITADNTFSAGRLDYDILHKKIANDALVLLGSGSAIYVTNIIAFGIWFWELDRGGPFERADATTPYPDFLFPQMTAQHMAPPEWEPRFVDYLYVSFTNVTAFSPTDTLPLSRWTKGLMALQSTVALTTIGLVVARAVNVLH